MCCLQSVICIFDATLTEERIPLATPEAIAIEAERQDRRRSEALEKIGAQLADIQGRLARSETQAAADRMQHSAAVAELAAKLDRLATPAPAPTPAPTPAPEPTPAPAPESQPKPRGGK